MTRHRAIPNVSGMEPPICPYCTGKSMFMDSSPFYGGRSFGMVWGCIKCSALVGCHPDGRPLGTLANKSLRMMRANVHRILDPHWQRGNTQRSTVYTILADLMGIEPKNCHVGTFNEAQCLEATRLLQFGLEPKLSDIARIRREVEKET